MDKGRGDDDTSAKLLDNKQYRIELDLLISRKLSQQDWRKDTNSAGEQDNKQQADSERDIIVSIDTLT